MFVKCQLGLRSEIAPMKITRRVFAASAAALAFGPIARADDAGPPASIDEVLARIARARANLRTLVGPFTQERTIGLLVAEGFQLAVAVGGLLVPGSIVAHPSSIEASEPITVIYDFPGGRLILFATLLLLTLGFLAVTEGGADAVLAASIFHFGEVTIAEAKQTMAAAGLPMRMS